MAEYEKVNSVLVSEANKILHDHGLLEILGNYGKPIVQGSYALNLMTWRDLDLYLENDELDVKSFFDMGQEMAERLKPRRMSFRNEFIGKTPGLLPGLYWGIYAKMTFPEEWKIDIWAFNSECLESQLRMLEDLKNRIDEIHRLPILAIKSRFCKHPEYRKKFFSMDIYKSVIEDNVRSIEEFVEWLEKERGLSVS